MVPSEEEQIQGVMRKMIGMQRHIRRKTLLKAVVSGEVESASWSSPTWQDGIEHCITKNKWSLIWERWASNRPHAVFEDQIKSLKGELKPFVVSHIDKHAGEGVIL